MKPAKFLVLVALCTVLVAAVSCTCCQPKSTSTEPKMLSQVPTWSRADLDFFLHGSMSTEMIPERVLRAFIQAYPDLFPTQDLTHLGMIPDPAFGWPVGFSRRPVPHLGGLPSVGVNCAACHVAEVRAVSGAQPVRVLGMTSHFDAEAFFGSVIVAGFRTSDPVNMKKYLEAYLAAGSPANPSGTWESLEASWGRSELKIREAMLADPFGTNGIASGGLHELGSEDLRLDQQSLTRGQDLSALARNSLKLFHNMRAALHVPDLPPTQAPPASGPGRNDAFGLLSLVLFGEAQPYAPVKYGLVWNLEHRRWVHWDGNTQSPIGRNLLAALGLGAPLVGSEARLNFANVKRHTDLAEHIAAPRYPWAVDSGAAQRGAAHYQANCARCHDGAEGDQRLYPPSEIGTEPTRSTAFTQLQADRFNHFLAGIKTPGYEPSSVPGIRGTGKMWSPSLAGVWARSPYLHNGSVRTMEQLLRPAAARAASFQRGTRVFDPVALGFTDEGGYKFDASTAGNANQGHEYGTTLLPAQKRDLIEYLKTL